MRIWIKGFLALACIGLLIWLLVQISGLALGVLRAHSGHTGERDPMFAEEVQYIQPTPETAEEEDPVIYRDNSANWDTSVQTPVDRTARELAEEETPIN
jgi:hypothetical protein